MANFSSSFLQHRASILGNKGNENVSTATRNASVNPSFQKHREFVLSSPKRVQTAPVKITKPQKVETFKEPIKVNEKGGLFEIVANTIKNTVENVAPILLNDTVNQRNVVKIVKDIISPEAKKTKKEAIGENVNKQLLNNLTSALKKHFEEKAPITALIQGNPKEFLSRVDKTIKESNLASVGKPIKSEEDAQKAIENVLDVTPLGIGTITKKAIQSIAKSTSPTAIKNILTKEIKSLSDDVAENLSKKLSTIKDQKIVENEIENAIRTKGADLRKELYPKQVESVVDDFQDLQKLSKETPQQQPINKQPRQEISPSESHAMSSTSDLPPVQHSSGQLYNETPKITKTIEKTAKEIKDKPNLVRRVMSSVGEIKTKVIENIQNEQERVRKLVDRKDVIVDDVSDPYLKATLYPGRVGEKIKQGKDEVEAIIKEMKKTSSKLKTDLPSIRKEVNDYLYYKHAPERNAVLGKKAAGITTEEALEGLRKIESSPEGAKIKELADRVRNLNEQTLDVLRQSGVISDELYTTLRKKYKNHVPLNRIFEESEDVGAILSGRGFDVRSTGIKRAKGSEREVDDILENVVTNYEQAILRSEKNIVDQATLAFARKNKDALGNLLEIKKPKAIGKDFKGRILTEKTNDPTVLQLFENGKPVWIKINDPHLAIALRNVGREKLGGLLNAVASFTRLYSGLATRFNPEFALPNKIRDLQETAVYLASQKGVGFSGATKTASRDLLQQNTKAVLDGIRGKNTEGARLYKELKELGGTTGGFGLSTKQQVELNLKDLEKLANSKTKRIGDNLVKYIDNWNTIFEDSTRLSVYRQALKQGLSKERAAFLAKEASINFNRMGKGGPIINALWMFSNASIQGTTKMIRALKNPKVLGATVSAVGSATAVVNQWNDRIDPEWRDKVSKWDRLNGLPIVLPNEEGDGAKYFTIPVSWGIKPIKVMSDYAYDAVSGNKFDTKTMIEDTLTSMLEAYNPVGGSDFVSAISPTILDVPFEINRNRAWHGNKIKPDYDANAPADIQYFDSLGETKTGQAAISISELLQSKAGISVSPADMKYAFEQYVGGAGRTISKTLNTITGAAGGELPPIDEYPMLSRFYRERTEEEVGAGAGGQTQDIKEILETQSRERFRLKEEAEKKFDELSKLSKDEANAKAREIKKDNPELFSKLKDIKEEKALGLNYTERLIKQLGVENGERAKYILTQVDELKTKEEKNEYIRNLREKKVISDKVFEQLKYFLKNR